MLEEFDRELDRGDAGLGADLARLADANMAGHMNMADHMNRCISALNADAIHPVDFADKG
jgi:hypothetical protein